MAPQARKAGVISIQGPFSSTAGGYLSSANSRLDNYLSLLIQYDTGTHESIVGQPFRGLELGPGVLPKLQQARTDLRRAMWSDLRGILLAWYQKLVIECDNAQSDVVLDVNTKHMCNLHAHLLLMLRNAELD